MTCLPFRRPNGTLSSRRSTQAMPVILTPQEEIDASLDQLKEQFRLVDDPRESDHRPN
jgi:hypothetical protein